MSAYQGSTQHSHLQLVALHLVWSYLQEVGAMSHRPTIELAPKELGKEEVLIPMTVNVNGSYDPFDSGRVSAGEKKSSYCIWVNFYKDSSGELTGKVICKKGITPFLEAQCDWLIG